MYGWYYDPTFILVFAGLILTLIASAGVKSTFSRYSRVRCMAGYTGAQAAQEVLRISGIYDVRIERVAGQILRRNGIYDVQVTHIAGNLTDHYDPRNKTLALSDPVYNSTSVAAIGVAAHECGHAIQHQKGYGPLVLRSTLVPAANIGSSLSWPIFVAGLIFSMRPLLMLGILLFGLAVIFQLVTLPVEFNASSRAIRILEGNGMLGESEITGAKKVLRAAAMTYVASLASSILQLLRLVILAGGNRRDD